jgi:hypothetical protein
MKPLPWKATDFRAVTHAFALGFYFRVSTEGSSNGFFVCQNYINPQSGLANGPMSGPHSRNRCRYMTPGGVALLSDH